MFQTAIGDEAVSAAAQVQMVAAVQPFLSGGVSKTVQLPAGASVEEVEQVFVDAWRAGLKSISVFREGSKLLQPLTTISDEGLVELPPDRPGGRERAGAAQPLRPTRRSGAR